jgi:hypothetical protein
MTNISVIRENIQGIRDESPDSPMVLDHVSAIETCVDLIEQGIDPETDYTFNKQIFTREDVRIAVKNNIHADNIIRCIDMLLNSGQEYQAALKLSCIAHNEMSCPIDSFPDECMAQEPNCENNKSSERGLICWIYYFINKARREKADETRTD